MSWLQRLNETYEACFGSTRLDVRGLAPVGSVIQRTQIEVALYDDGTFASATLEDHQTIMFTTEDSASRSGTAPAANPLTEQLEYCAKGMERFEGDPAKHNRYIQVLASWNSSDFGNQTTAAVLKYVNTGSLLEDLIHERVITQKDGELEKVKVSRQLNSIQPRFGYAGEYSRFLISNPPLGKTLHFNFHGRNSSRASVQKRLYASCVVVRSARHRNTQKVLGKAETTPS